MTTINHELAPAHAKPRDWTGGQKSLAAALGLLGGAITVPTFIVIYQTVTHLVWPWFGHWSWTVVAAGEICFVGIWGFGILLSWRGETGGALRPVFLTGLVAGSFYLNIYAAHGNAPDAISHMLIVAAFFGYMLVAKAAIVKLRAAKGRPDRVTPAEWCLHPWRTAQLRSRMALWEETSKAAAKARLAALRYATALVQADPRIGRGADWRRRLPVTLRYQLSEGILPPDVSRAIATAYGGAATWQAPVAEWVAAELGLLGAPDAPSTAPDIVPDEHVGDTTQGTGGGSQDRREKRRTPGDDWPSARGMDRKLLARRTAAAAGKWEAAHGGELLPATQLAGMLRVRISRDRAAELLRAHYGPRYGHKPGLRAAR